MRAGRDPLEGFAALEGRVPGIRLRLRPSVDSTNRVLARMARRGAPVGTVVIADRQEAGRGRFGRSWASPPGRNLYLSLLLPADGGGRDGIVCLGAAAAAAETVESCAPGAPSGLKWPNDVMLAGRKTAGILAETVPGRADVLVLGIGVNLNMEPEDFPPELRRRATSVRIVTGRRVDRAAFAADLLDRLWGAGGLLRSRDRRELLDRWRAKEITLGRELRLRAADRVVFGRAVDVDAEGALVLRRTDGVAERFFSGEVSLR